MHDPVRRPGHPLLPHVGGASQWPHTQHGGRPGAQRPRAAPAAASLPGRAWPAVRFLHAGHPHDLASVLAGNPGSHRNRGARGDFGQLVPLPRLPAHRRSRAAGRPAIADLALSTPRTMTASIVHQLAREVTAYQLPQLENSLRSGELPIANYLDTLEHRFEAVEPSVQAFMPEDGRFARLRAQAEELLRRWPDPDTRPPLFGLPVGIKDIMRVDGLPTTGGSRLPASLFDAPESACVTQLKKAGALIAGKTVSTEFAYFGPGPTHNPHHLAHTPGGSSSGSAAGVAAGLCPLALGTQTVGSIIRPAAFCGVVGFKPSLDRIPKADVIPLSQSLDHIGVFAANVPGVVPVAQALLYSWHSPDVWARPVLGVPDGPYLAQAGEEARRV